MEERVYFGLMGLEGLESIMVGKHSSTLQAWQQEQEAACTEQREQPTSCIVLLTS